jgi:hypothetical protein
MIPTPLIVDSIFNTGGMEQTEHCLNLALSAGVIASASRTWLFIFYAPIIQC